MMRVCLVSKELSGFRGGGIGTYVTLMARALSDAGHQVHVLTEAHPGLVDGSKDPHLITYHSVRLDEGMAALEGYGTEQARYAMAVHHRLLEINRQHRFELVEFPEYGGEGYFSLCANQWSKCFQGTRLAVRLHTPSRDVRLLNRDARLDLAALEIDHLEDVSVRLADVVFSPTQSLLDRVLARIERSGPSKVIPHPFDETWTAQRHRHGPDGPPTVLYFGRKEFRKGLHVLLEAAQSLFERGHAFRVRLVGADTSTGPFGRSLTAWLRKSIAPRWEDRFEFLEAVPREQLIDEIRAAALCCFPSIWENFPNVCLEAMALGCPVVVSDAGGMGEIVVPDESGLVFRSGDSQHLAQQLKRLLLDPELGSGLGEAGVARVGTYCNPLKIAHEVERTLDAMATPGDSAAPAPASGAPSARDISVIIPFYNLHAFLPETLASLAAQSLRGFETIIVDDGSTAPQSLELLSRLESEGYRIIRKPNGGLSSARNAGIAASKGRWILPLDADDLIAPTFLEKMWHALMDDPKLAYATSLVSLFHERPDRPFAVWTPLGLHREMLPLTNAASTCTALFSREVLEQAGGYDEWLTSFEDWDLYCTLAERGHTGAVLPEFLFHYRVRPGSLVRTEVVQRRYDLIAYLIQKHPGLSSSMDRTLRALLGEQAKSLDRSALRYRLVDTVNDALKELPLVHPLLKMGAQTLARLRGR